MEIDAYCFSKVAGRALSGAVSTTSLSKDNILEAFNTGLLYLENNEVPAENQILFVSPTTMSLLRNGNTSMARLLQSDFNKDVKFSLTSYEGRKLAVVPPARFKTEIDLSSNGIAWGESSADIDFMFVAKDAVMHVVKYNKVKILQGDVVLAGQGFDGYAIYARVYHDVFVPDNKRYAIYVHTSSKTTQTDPAIKTA